MMRCLECDIELPQVDNPHLLACSGLTLQEYAIRHHLPLDLLIDREELNREDPVAAYPRPAGHPSERARALLRALAWAGLLREEGLFTVVPGEVRRLDLLLWDLDLLRELGFRFRQEYSYADATHRVVARNRLKVPSAHLRQSPDLHLCAVPPPDFRTTLAAFIAHVGELQAAYLFLQFPRSACGQAVAAELRPRGVVLTALEAADHPGGILLRTLTRADTDRLLDWLSDDLAQIPGASERFRQATPEVTVAKELVFDSAHFITDHPAKCSNLHGGRYVLHVKVRGRIDPVTGCVVDYGYLKRVVNRKVIDRFDHHNLNFAAPELAWRSSTEMLCIYIWEQLIDYLPGLVELELYETTQSWCTYRGPALETFQRKGSDPLMTHFAGDVGRSPLRDLLRPPALEVAVRG